MADDEIVIDESVVPAGADAEVGEPGTEEALAPAEPTMADVLKQIQAIQTHVGRIPALQSRMDSMTKNIDSTVEKRLKESQRDQYISQLTPEQRQEYEQQQRQRQETEAYLQKLVQANMQKTIGEDFGGMMETFHELQDKKKADNFFTTIEETLGEEDSKRIAPMIGQMLAEHRRKINSGDPALVQEADAWMTKALEAPERVALRALRQLQTQVNNSENRVVDERRERGKSLGLQPRGGAPAGPKSIKNLKGLSEKEILAIPGIADMPTAEYQKLLNASR